MRGCATVLLLAAGCGGSVAVAETAAPADAGAPDSNATTRAPVAACALETTLASLPNGITSLAVDRTHVYFSGFGDSGGFFRAPIDGSAAEALFFGHGAVVVDTSYVYYAPCTPFPATLMRWAKAGEPEAWAKLCTSELVATEKYLYASENYTVGGGGGPPPFDERRLVRIDKRTAELVVISDPFGDAFAADADYVYFNGASRSEVRRLPTAGGAAPEHVGDAAPGWSIDWMAIERGALYVMESSGDYGAWHVRVERFTAGAAPTRLVDDVAATSGSCFGVSDGKVYFGSDTALLYTSVDGGAPTILARSSHCRGIAFDATSVYWSSGDSYGQRGELHRACKP